jgi:hypothetical protein
MKIFISYRRDDSAGYAGRLFDFLSVRFGSKNVFMDVDTIEPGDDFRKVLKNAVETCDVVLVMIGKQWLSMTDAKGQRRLDNSSDWVRVEIATALAKPDVRVIPVLVRGAPMPKEHELPEDLKELSWRNALELSDSRFQHDASKLVQVIERTTELPKATLAIRRFKINPAKYWAISIGVLVLSLVIGVALDGHMPTLIASPTPSPTLSSETTPEVVVETVVDVVWAYFHKINNATEKEQIINSWNMLTTDQQNNSQDQGQPENFLAFWWQWHVIYKIYYCDPYTVIVEYRLIPRNQESAPQETERYERYRVIEDHGQLKINQVEPTSGVNPACTFVIDAP